MKDFSIIIGFLAIMAVACSPKEDDCDHDGNRAAATDVEKGEDATDLADAATLTDKECYVKCVKTDMSELDCKKACYGDWTKDDKCESCYDKCKEKGGNTANCKLECCDVKPKDDKPLPGDAGSNPKEEDVEADAGATVETDSGADLPEDVSASKG